MPGETDTIFRNITKVVALDPGLRGSGVAAFDTAVLTWAGWVANPRHGIGSAAWRAMGREIADVLKSKLKSVDLLVTEVMQHYPGSGSAKWLLELSGVVGATSASLDTRRPDVNYLPNQWKGSTPKGIQNARDLAKLSTAEKACIKLPRNSKEHDDVYDAIGIGLAYLRKMGIRND